MSAKATDKVKIWESDLEVVGLRFRMAQDTRKGLHRVLTRRKEIDGLRLVREPDNHVDPNAVKVMLPADVLGGRQLGYLHRQTAEFIADKLDAGYLAPLSVTLTAMDKDDDYQTATIAVTFQGTQSK